MIYSFSCECGTKAELSFSMKDGPPADPKCPECRGKMQRDWKADAPMIDTSACRDHSSVGQKHLKRSAWDGNKSADRVEREFKQHIDGRRKQIRDAGGQRGSIKQTHAVPSHLYHGKIKETGDPNYWSDPKNLNRHTECKVDD